jgi:hypothetical protein
MAPEPSDDTEVIETRYDIIAAAWSEHDVDETDDV